MKLLICSLAFGLTCSAAAYCSAALVPLPQGAIRVAIINGPWPADVSSWSRTDEPLLSVFYQSSTSSMSQYTPGQRVQVYDRASNQVAKGIVVARPDTHDHRDQRGIFSKSVPSPLDYERLIGWEAVPLHAGGPDLTDPSIPFVGPLVEPVVVPEPASLFIWSLAFAAVAVLGAVYRRRRC